MSVRLKDIARDLGVSAVTVSKVLHNHRDIGSETRERVLRRIKELNYQPNQNARALATGRTHLVGLIVPDLLHSFFAQVTKGVFRTLRKHGYGLIIASSEENPEFERQEIDQMLARHVEALIVASTQKTAQSFSRITARHVPYVLVDRKFEGLNANFIGTDDVKAGMLATEHLIYKGCRRIAHIGGDYLSTAADRLAGYRAALLQHGFEAPQKYIFLRTQLDDAAMMTGYRAMLGLLKLEPRPDGVFCFSDPIAAGAMQAILERGLRIPEDVAIIGCGNVLYASALRVPLSSVNQKSEILGERAAKVVLDLVGENGGQREPRDMRLRPTLVVRASSDPGAAPPSQG
jgi:LacI family transcriptional regulator, galactose operon repressor